MLVTYMGANSPVTERNITGTFVRSAAGDRVTRDDSGPGWSALGLFVDQTIELIDAGSTNSRGFTIAGFSADDRTLIFRETNVVQARQIEGFKLKTTAGGADNPADIGNLVKGTQYLATVSGGRVLLSNPATPNVFIRYQDSGAGIQGFRYIASTATFSPVTAVDPTRDTITLNGHGFQTGDMLVYRTDPNRTTQQNIATSPVPSPMRQLCWAQPIA